MIRTLALVLVATVLASACGSVSRPDTITALVDEHIAPTFVELAAVTAALESSTAALCSEPAPEHLEAVRHDLAAARLAWSRSEAMWVGPVMDRRSWAVIDWPASTEEIDALIDDAEPLTVDRLRARVGADQRGLQAVAGVLLEGRGLGVVAHAPP